MRWLSVPLAALLVFAVVHASAFGHAERTSYYPNPPNAQSIQGSVPKHRSIWTRSGGRRLVVCKRDSGRRIRGIFRGKSRRARRLRNRQLRLLKRCRFGHIQAAVNAAPNGARILLLPGVYREEPSRDAPEPDPKCKDLYEEIGPDLSRGQAEGERAPSYQYHVDCPNDQNMIAILGDGPDSDRKCDRKCNIQIEGTGRRARDVLITGKRSKLNVIRADRADGIYLRNFTVEFSDFNNVYALETNGFVFDRIVSRWSREYGFLVFTSDHGLFHRVTAYGSGDSGIYPGSGPEGHCVRYGIEIRQSESYGNNIGYSGTAGNGVWAHDNKFHHNSTGMTTDSFAAGHPGMPQDCAKWENNEIYSNNLDIWNAGHDEYCRRPVEQRDPKVVCPTFQVPVGTGILIAGGNRNIIRNNHIYDNWRFGTMQFWVPDRLRGEDPSGQSENTGNAFDTSNGNRYEGNFMGMRPDGTRDPNGTDFWWDEEGQLNCWSENRGPGGAQPTSDPRSLPACPGSPILSPGNQSKQAFLVPCATWDSSENTDPPGCDWFTLPPEPR